MTDRRSTEATRAASSARLKARWADPLERARMLDAAAKGCERAAELVRQRKPTPADPALKSKFNYVRSICGPAEARRAFGLEADHD